MLITPSFTFHPISIVVRIRIVQNTEFLIFDGETNIFTVLLQCFCNVQNHLLSSDIVSSTYYPHGVDERPLQDLTSVARYTKILQEFNGVLDASKKSSTVSGA